MTVHVNDPPADCLARYTRAIQKTAIIEREREEEGQGRGEGGGEAPSRELVVK